MGRSRHAVGHDGTRIAWTSTGAGAPPVLLTDGIGCAGWIWRRLVPVLAAGRRVIHWNYRGHGASGPPPDPERATVDDCVRDLLAVLDASRAGPAVLIGHSMGVQVVLEAAARAPARVAGLVLVCGAPGRLLDTFHDSTALRTALPWARRVVNRWPEVARVGFRALVTADVALDYALAFEVNRALLHRDDLLPYFEDLSRVDPLLFVRLLASAAEHDATPHLARIHVPTLVVAGDHDSFTPMRLSVRMHEVIPGSELLVLPGGTHVAPLEHPELFAARVRAFLFAPRRPAPPRSARRKATPRGKGGAGSRAAAAARGPSTAKAPPARKPPAARKPPPKPRPRPARRRPR
jgi:pimeloyl-ACP methyl ester carboxylesterase